ncbi:MAG: hypothetical protein AB7T07_08520 [Steroidobacteraceae bacterium]
MSRRFIIAATVAMACSGSALADTPMVATLAAPTIAQKQILGSVIWRCADTTCTSTSAPKDPDVVACHEVARRFGIIAAFTSQNGSLNEADLEKCNKNIQAK